MSRGQKAKFVANNTKMKKYSRKDAEANIDKILENKKDGIVKKEVAKRRCPTVLSPVF